MAVDVDDVDLAEFLALTRRKGPRCSVAVVLDSLADDQRAKLIAALDEPTVSHAAISKWLALRDIRVVAQTIARHRHGECGCDE